MTDTLDWADVAAIGVVARLHYPADYPRLVHRSLVRSRWDDHRRIVADALRSAYEAGGGDGAHARRELAALEWLALRGYPVGRCPETGRVMALYDTETGEPRWHSTWADVARDCGWEE